VTADGDGRSTARTRVVARVVGAIVLVAVAVGLLLGRCRVSQGSEEAELERGLGALASALSGDHARFAEAEDAFARASGGSIFDAYPLFMLELSRGLREGRAPESDPAVRAIVVRLGTGDVRGALALLPTIPEAFPGRRHLERAVIELARRTPDH